MVGKDTNFNSSYSYIYSIMNKNIYHIIGLMSGTSLDGIDLIYVKFDVSKGYTFEILNAETVSYSAKWVESLRNAIHQDQQTVATLGLAYGKFLGETINTFIAKNKIETIDFIASHGHTIFHKPEEGYTLQIGDGQTIANITNQQVICDFRTEDVTLGGQGAPLVPIGDKLLFNNYDYCLNLGGFANISFEKNNQRLAYDICPVNIVLNHYVNTLNLPYDDGGKIAASGSFNEALFNELNGLPYYSEAFPKSLGLEWVQAHVFPMIDSYNLEISTILHTFVKHVAYQLALNFKENSSILVTGGGAYNTFLINELKQEKSLTVKIPENKLVDFKEALIFALLGLLKSQKRVNVLSSVTGASKDHSSGKIFYPKP